MTNPISGVFTTLAADVQASLLGLVTQMHANIAANPTLANVQAQGALFVLTAPTQLPSLETQTILAVNDAILATFTSALTPAAK